MSLHDPLLVAQDMFAVIYGPDLQPAPEDRRNRLLEAGSMGCCAEGDLLALMPSVDAPAPPWRDDRTWLRRILGF